jgi:hypothetical protein
MLTIRLTRNSVSIIYCVSVYCVSGIRLPYIVHICNQIVCSETLLCLMHRFYQNAEFHKLGFYFQSHCAENHCYSAN